MSRERRLSPRKPCAVPLRFRVFSNGNSHSGASGEGGAPYEQRPAKAPSFLSVFEGETVNLSERGMYFRSRQAVRLGDPLEMYFTMPRELTGRESEQVRCSARVVHVDQPSDQRHSDPREMIGVGVTVERYETLAMARNWGN